MKEPEQDCPGLKHAHLQFGRLLELNRLSHDTGFRTVPKKQRQMSFLPISCLTGGLYWRSP